MNAATILVDDEVWTCTGQVLTWQPNVAVVERLAGLGFIAPLTEGPMGALRLSVGEMQALINRLALTGEIPARYARPA